MSEYKSGQKKHAVFREFLTQRVRFKDFYLGLFLFIFSLVLIFWLIPEQVEISESWGQTVKADFFPYAITFLLAGLSLLLIFQSNRTGRFATRVEDKKVSSVTVICILILFAFYFGIMLIGMVPMGILSLFALMKTFGFRRWHWALLLSITFVLGIFFFFEEIAQVAIPRGILLEDWY
jgi:branched-subunit amino acid transport protein AzlD